MSLLVFLLLLTVFLATLGRSAIPQAERPPWHIWTWRDVVANVARGARVLSKANEGQRLLWERLDREMRVRDNT